MHPIRLALQFIEDCGGDPNAQEVIRKLLRYGSAFGFEHFVYTEPPAPNRPLSRPVTSDGWPLEWYERYRSRNYLAVDPLAHWTMRTNQAFTYGEIPECLLLPDRARNVRAEASEFGFVDGLVVPIAAVGCSKSAIILNGSHRCELSPQDKSALQLVAAYAASFIRLGCDNEAVSGRLSAREREVLAWAAAGKSAWEASVILSVSERTITKHLEHVRTKLNAASTAQAVAEALRLGEIVL